jgi:thioredoxin 1
MNNILNVNSDNWEKEVLQSNVLTLVDFWHDKCKLCKQLEPVYKEVAEEYKDKLKFAKLNILETHENQHLAIHNGIRSTPTLIFFCKGKPLQALVGPMKKEQLKKKIDEVIEKNKDCLKK